MILKGRLRQMLAAGVFGLYALVAGVLIPLHVSMEAREAGEALAPRGDGADDSGTTRSESIWDVSCQDPDCKNPAHHHHQSHTHDPATCSSCAQARAAATSDAVAIAPAPEPAPAGRAAHAPEHAVLDTVRALPNVRGPPALS